MNRLLALLLLALLGTTAQAATVCRLVSGVSIAFGAYDVLLPSPNDSLVSIDVTCDRNGGPQRMTLSIGIGPGLHGSSVSARRMFNPGGSGDYLAYGLYRDAARSSVWGSTDGADTMSQQIAVPNKGSATATFTIYGRIPALQDVSVGSYSDSVQITLTY